jgi:2-dehydro-3-deoxyglucarate aldolase/4-hydroxy-2-oxoheptanedioate aldolase
MLEKTLKQRIHNGEAIVGVSVPIWTTQERLQAILDRGDYHFVSTDSQHAAFNEERLVAFCEIANELNVPVQFRIKHTRHTYLIGNYLDLGPSGVEVPQVERELTVDEAIANFYYPQVGIRSWGGVARKGAANLPDRLAYAKWWNESGVLWMQVESVEAVTSARRLAKPGVDCLSFGPADLTFSLEAHPNHPFKTVDDCVRYVAKQLEGTSVAVCFRNGRPDTRAKYAEMGVTVFLESPLV